MVNRGVRILYVNVWRNGPQVIIDLQLTGHFKWGDHGGPIVLGHPNAQKHPYLQSLWLLMKRTNHSLRLPEGGISVRLSTMSRTWKKTNPLTIDMSGRTFVNDQWVHFVALTSE